MGQFLRYSRLRRPAWVGQTVEFSKHNDGERFVYSVLIYAEDYSIANQMMSTKLDS